MAISPWIDAIQTASIGALEQVIPRGSSVALVDFPSHQNAGDTLIYAGERKYLKRLEVSVDYLCDFTRYNARTLSERVPDGPILLHGGGNFGDRWPQYEALRKQVVSDFPGRRIVLLPQSIDYTSQENLDSTRRVFAQHADLTIMIREQRSLLEARQNFGDANNVIHCPDMAFGIGAQSPTARRGQVDVVRLMRGDSERVERPQIVTRHSTSEHDWGLRGANQLAWKALRIPGRLSSTVPAQGMRLYPLVANAYRAQAALNLRDARRILSSGRVILTDRLHAAVLGGLMGSPVVALDNVYGKVGDVFDDYLHTFPNVKYANTAEEACALVNARFD